jgi:putative membrane-bound dehydrogenase-like protein
MPFIQSATLCFLALMLVAQASADPAAPRSLDPRLKIELFAAEPEIVTPCGLAVDARSRVLVVESHTHFRPQNYTGPQADRIRLLEDRDGDGRADRVTNFYEGTKWTMNVGVHSDGSVYVATRSEIFRLRDANDDGVADERTPIVRLESAGNYPHNGLSGFAFDFDGNVYFGLGENLGVEFKLVGTDGSLISDREGGQVYRCRADGSQLEMVAFGFWNPFHLAFDAFGRLFAVDNDPDSLPPCRLLHIVPGGNYGYRYRNGRKGVHPFTAWNGELPGTLPMVAGTGEAPSGVLAYESDGLPDDYIGDLLVTSWGDHRIERHRPSPRGASFRSQAEPIITGGDDFRPVGIAVAPDGSLLVSDWVLKDYDLHGKGRVWRIASVAAQPRRLSQSPVEQIRSRDRLVREQAARALVAGGQPGRAALEQLARDPAPRVRALALQALKSLGVPKPLVDAAVDDGSLDVRTAVLRASHGVQLPKELFADGQPDEVRAEAMRRAADPADADALWQAVQSTDAFTAQAARRGLAQMGVVDAEFRFQGRTAAERLACALVMRESRDPAAERALPALLADPDPDVRFAAVQWVGEERLSALRAPLLAAISAGPGTARLFSGYLAALENLDGVRRESSDEWAGEQYVVRALDDPRTGAEVRRWALRTLRPDHPQLSLSRLEQFLESDDSLLRLEAVRTLRDSPHSKRGAILARIAADERLAEQLRAEAVVGLSAADPTARSLLVALAQGESDVLGEEALRSLRGAELDSRQRAALVALAARDKSTAELVARVLEPAATPTASQRSVDQWLALLRGSRGQIEGDPQAGERIFFHAQSATCSRCHQIAGRGQRIGPELTATASALAERRLVESIVEPGKEIAPQFVSWQVVTESGQSLLGMLVHEQATGEQTYADPEGRLFEFKAGEIAERRPSATSVMPTGLAERMTLDEFRDLLAFLRAGGVSQAP